MYNFKFRKSDLFSILIKNVADVVLHFYENIKKNKKLYKLKVKNHQESESKRGSAKIKEAFFLN